MEGWEKLRAFLRGRSGKGPTLVTEAPPCESFAQRTDRPTQDTKVEIPASEYPLPSTETGTINIPLENQPRKIVYMDGSVEDSDSGIELVPAKDPATLIDLEKKVTFTGRHVQCSECMTQFITDVQANFCPACGAEFTAERV